MNKTSIVVGFGSLSRRLNHESRVVWAYIRIVVARNVVIIIEAAVVSQSVVGVVIVMNIV